MLSAICFVPKGAAKEVPQLYVPSQDEIEMLAAKQQSMSLEDSELTDDRLVPAEEREEESEPSEDEAEDDDSKDADMEAKTEPAAESKDKKKKKKKEKKQTATNADADADIDTVDPAADRAVEDQVLKDLNMDAYDDEEDGATLFLGGAKLMYHATNAQDPFISVPDEEDVSDDEDTNVKADDAVIIIGKTEDEDSAVEVQIYDETQESLFVHHDFALPAFPLAFAWLNRCPSADEKAAGPGSFLAVATFKPEIEIWNLDVMDVLEPSAVLGGRDEATAAKVVSKKKKGGALKEALLGKFKPGSHTDAVMCLSWHPAHRERLASGSADSTVKLWDVTTQQCMATLQHHSSKVQSIEWNPREPSVLLSGAFDRSVTVLDVRAPTKTSKYPVDADIECVRWNPHNPALFCASTESGSVICHDVRRPESIFTLGAHTKATSALSFNLKVPNLMSTVSLDKTAKLWDVTDNKPSLVAQRNLKAGELFCGGFHPDAPFLLASGGNKGKLAVWDTWGESAVASKYAAFKHLVRVPEPVSEEVKKAAATITARPSATPAPAAGPAPGPAPQSHAQGPAGKAAKGASRTAKLAQQSKQKKKK